MYSLLSIISIILGFIAVLFLFQYLRLRSRIAYMKWRTYRLEGELSQPRRPEIILADKSSKELKNELKMNRPKLFYYLDKTIVVSVHNQIRELFSPESKEVETIGKKGGEIGIDEGIKAYIGKADIKRRLEKFTISENIETTYNDVEKYLIRNEQITFGLECFDYDHSIENDFFRSCEKIKEEFDFEIPQAVKDDFVEKYKSKYTRDEKIRHLKEVKGFVIMREDFNISTLLSNQQVLTFCNPYEKGENKICIEVPLDKNNITTTGKRLFPISNKAKLTVLGKIILWDSTKLQLNINPIVVF